MADGSGTTVTSCSDLETVGAAAVALTEYLACMVNGFRDALHGDQSRLAPERDELQSAVDELDRLSRDVKVKRESVRAVLDIASGRGRSAVDDLLKFAGSVDEAFAEVLAGNNSPLPNAMHNWLCWVSDSLDRSKLAESINREVEQAAAIRAANKPRQSRFRCEPSDRSVFLDGKRIACGLNEEVFAYLEVLTDNYPDPIPFGRIQEQAPALLGVNQSRFNMELPREINKLVARGQRGHVLKLPN